MQVMLTGTHEWNDSPISGTFNGESNIFFNISTRVIKANNKKNNNIIVIVS